MSRNLFEVALFAVFLHSTSAGAAIRVRSGENQRFFLSAESCQVLREQLVALRSWKKKIDGQQVTEDLPCTKEGAKQFSVEITVFMPHALQHLSDKQMDEVNCHGTSLYLTGLHAELKHQNYDYALGVMKTQCKERSTWRKPVQGQIGWGEGWQHTFIWINENLIFDKDGPKAPRFISLTDLKKEYSITAGYYLCKPLNPFPLKPLANTSHQRNSSECSKPRQSNSVPSPEKEASNIVNHLLLERSKGN